MAPRPTSLAFLGLGLLLGYGLHRVDIPRATAGSEEHSKWTPDLRGDVNADGRLDVSDAIFLLNYCFLDGTRPGALPSRESAAVLETGQTRCYDGVRGLEQDPCPGPGMPDYGQDPNFLAGVPRRFELFQPDAEDPDTWYTVDHATGLMWQYREEGRRHWRGALEHAERLELGGFDDWRMPNIRELLTLTHFGRRNPAAYTEYFDILPTVYWSSTTSEFDGSRAFTVRFSEGFINFHEKGQAGIGSNRFYSLAVRDASE